MAERQQGREKRGWCGGTTEALYTMTKWNQYSQNSLLLLWTLSPETSFRVYNFSKTESGFEVSSSLCNGMSFIVPRLSTMWTKAHGSDSTVFSGPRWVDLNSVNQYQRKNSVILKNAGAFPAPTYQSAGAMTTRKHIQVDLSRKEPVSLQCVPPIIWQILYVFPELCAAAKQTAWLMPHFTVSQCLSVLITLRSRHTRGQTQRSLTTIADDVLAEGGPGKKKNQSLRCSVTIDLPSTLGVGVNGGGGSHGVEGRVGLSVQDIFYRRAVLYVLWLRLSK